jgi:hypothetical protein
MVRSGSLIAVGTVYIPFSLASREGLDNLTVVINCNLQRLDGVSSRFEAMGRSFGSWSRRIIDKHLGRKVENHFDARCHLNRSIPVEGKAPIGPMSYKLASTLI